MNNQRENKKPSIDILKNFLDLYLLVEPEYKNRLQVEENKWLRKVSLFHYTLWPLTFVIFFFMADMQKKPLDMFIYYRFGAAFSIWFLGAVTYIFKGNNTAIKILLYITCAVISFFINWSMTFGPSVQYVWVGLHAAFILATFSSSLVSSVLWLCIIILSSYPMWSTQYGVVSILAISIFYLVLLIYGYISKKIWIQSNINKFLHDDSMQKKPKPSNRVTHRSY